MKIHHYHHLGEEEKRLLQTIVKATSDITSRLRQIQENLLIMSEQEQELNDKIELMQKSLDSSQERALKAIERANSATGVVQKQVETLTELVEELRENQPNLTDEIAKVEAVIEDANAFLKETPPDEEETPTEEIPVDEEETPSEETPPVDEEETPVDETPNGE